MTQRRQFRVERIDPAFEPATLVSSIDDLGDARRNLVRRIGEPCAQRKQIALHRHEHRSQIVVESGSHGRRRARPAVRRRRRRRRRAGRFWRRASRQTGWFRRRRRFLCRFSLVEIIRCPCLTTPPPTIARQQFRRRLLAWYRKHGRDLPWRKTDDPYHILVSEIMLQQTQVDRVLPKYHEWLEKYPSFEALADGAG